MPGNSKRKGAIKKTGKGNPTAGSGGRVRRGLEGKGPTPKAKDRPYHKTYQKPVKDESAVTGRPRRTSGKAGSRSGSGDHETASRRATEVRAMLGVLGLDPAHAHWSTDSSNDLTGVVDALVKGLLDQRAEARAAKDFATADAIRDRIKAAGVTIEDTPTGPKWSVG